ncbi:MAG TPA: TldD/PmbA family protein [Chroococcales cyanobacterium]|jgi:TldD protein
MPSFQEQLMTAHPLPAAQIALDPRMIQKVLDEALGNGADFAEIFVEDRTSSVIHYLGQRVKDILSGQDRGAGLRVHYGLKEIFASTNDLSEEGLLGLARTVAQAEKGEGKLHSVPFKESKTLYPHLFRVHPREVPKEEKIALLKRADEAARSFDPLVTQVDLSLSEKVQEVLIANSEGIWIRDFRPYVRINIQAIASDGKESQTGTESPGCLSGFEFIRDLPVEQLATNAARIAVTMLKADYAPSGKMPVIIESGFGGVIFHEACGHLLETTSVAKDASIFCGKLGQKIASDCVTAIDDGTMCNEWGSSVFDDEGLPTQKTVLIEKGILKSYMVDRLGGKKTGFEPTGSGRRESYRFAPTSRMRNTFIAPGPNTLEEMLKDVKLGLYARKMGGGSVEPATGDFNFAVQEGYMIRNGKIAEPVRGATLIGNGSDVLMKIDMVGKELGHAQGMCGSKSGNVPTNVGQPPIRVSEIIVGGRNAQ